MDMVLLETTKMRQMSSQIAYSTFSSSGSKDRSFPVGPQIFCVLLYLLKVVTLKKQEFIKEKVGVG